jgi:Flp pilus assembly protein CpaB
MGNLVGTFKKFLGNKNTVTILAVIAGVIVLWYFYNYRVNQAITTIKIPYAVDRIDTGKKIEIDNTKFKEITRSTLKDSDIITDTSFLEGKYVCVGTSIPANGFFYKSQVCEKQELPNSVLDNIEDGNTLYELSVNNELTFANSIYPGDYIDLYVNSTDDDRKILYGALIEGIQVLAVRDHSGRDVFWDSTAGDSAFLLFSVPNDLAKLLEVAQSARITIKPVPRNASYSQNPGETNKIASEYLYNYIMNKAAVIQ